MYLLNSFIWGGTPERGRQPSFPLAFVSLEMDQPGPPELQAAAPGTPVLAVVATGCFLQESQKKTQHVHVLCQQRCLSDTFVFLLMIIGLLLGNKFKLL